MGLWATFVWPDAFGAVACAWEVTAVMLAFSPIASELKGFSVVGCNGCKNGCRWLSGSKEVFLLALSNERMSFGIIFCSGDLSAFRSVHVSDIMPEGSFTGDSGFPTGWNGCRNGCGVAVALLSLGRQLVGCIGCEIFCTLSDVTVERYLSASGVFSDFSCCSQTLWGIQSTGGISEPSAKQLAIYFLQLDQKFQSHCSYSTQPHNQSWKWSS